MKAILDVGAWLLGFVVSAKFIAGAVVTACVPAVAKLVKAGVAKLQTSAASAAKKVKV